MKKFNMSLIGAIGSLCVLTLMFGFPYSQTASAPGSTSQSLNLGNPVYVENDQAANQRNITATHFSLTISGNGTLMLNGTNIKTTDKGVGFGNIKPDGTVMFYGRVILTTADGGSATAVFYQKASTGAGVVIFLDRATGSLQPLKNELWVFHSPVTTSVNSTETFWKID